ncbi:MAG: helix-turn-helix transcriptional regulator [Bacteroidota bacterium]
MDTQEVARPNKPVLPNFIASNIRILRKRKGWSQAQLAERVFLNRGNIASYESGTAEPSICKLLRISNLFEVTPRDITRYDLNDPQALAEAKQAHDEKQTKERERLAQYRTRALELQELVVSSKRLFEYKQSKLENPCKEAELMAAQYDQLYEVTQQLLQEHRDLLGEVGCQCS